MKIVLDKLYNFFENEKITTSRKRYFIFDSLVIAVSILPLMFSFDQSITSIIEISTVTWFITDYLLRFLVSKLKYKKGIRSFFIYVVSFQSLIDLISILPVFLTINQGLKSLRIIRFIKTIRFFKLLKYNTNIEIIIKVLKKEASLLLTVFTLAIIFIFISSLMMYQIESFYQPEVFENFFDSLWWSFATLTSVGYGDVYPVSTEGRIIAMFVSFIGIAIVALPSGIIAAGFIEEFRFKKNNKQIENSEIILPHL